MKRILTFFLALGLLASMGSSALAEGTDGSKRLIGTGSFHTINVGGTYEGTATADKCYRVTVTWPNLDFTYAVRGSYEWDTNQYIYQDKTSLYLSGNAGREIKVVSDSNAPVRITAKFTQTEDQQQTGLKGFFEGHGTEYTFDLAACKIGAQSGQGESFIFSIDGAPLKEIEREKDITFGTITITVSDPTAAGG